MVSGDERLRPEIVLAPFEFGAGETRELIAQSKDARARLRRIVLHVSNHRQRLAALRGLVVTSLQFEAQEQIVEGLTVPAEMFSMVAVDIGSPCGFHKPGQRVALKIKNGRSKRCKRLQLHAAFWFW